MKNLKNSRYGNALDWALRSQNSALVTSIADIFLNVRLLPIRFAHFR